MGSHMRLVKHLFVSLSVICCAYILVVIDSVIDNTMQKQIIRPMETLRSTGILRMLDPAALPFSDNTSIPLPTPDNSYNKTRLIANETSRYSVNRTSVTHTTSVASYPMSQPKCESLSNLAFIKTHKTGSTTLRSILNRFGLARNLSFVFLKGSSNGHIPYYPLTDTLRKRFLPPIGVRSGNSDALRGYNISNVHLRFSRRFFDSFMTNGTKYITIVRDPLDQWLSVISFFGMKRYLPSSVRKTSFENIATTLAVNAKDLRKKMRNANHYYFQNNQIFDLGLSVKHSQDKVAITNYVNYLNGQFDLVLVNEYFDESLVLLRRLMCWDWTDILYVARNIQSRKHIVRNETTKLFIRQNNHADQYLYNFFNRTLWMKIQAYGDEFDHDLEYFRNLSTKFYTDCSIKDVEAHGKVLHKFNNVSSRFCLEVQADNQLPRIIKRQQVTALIAKSDSVDHQQSAKSGINKDVVNVQTNRTSNVNVSQKLEDSLLGKVVPPETEPKYLKEARLACERDPMCIKVVLSKQADGKTKLLHFTKRRRKATT
ncbi:galactosylceramide sulfotransferase-like isoform X2 [Apostichopus japonicus]|uniref:galactosylceramide sulfotransferase-like isoform X2 n=1 Tax=Stichopus japonicus TaxID=307972 RepID=UPI003AB740D5